MCVRILFGIFLTLSPVWNLKRWKTNQQVSLRQPACHSAGQSVLWPIFQWQRHSDGQPWPALLARVLDWEPLLDWSSLGQTKFYWDLPFWLPCLLLQILYVGHRSGLRKAASLESWSLHPGAGCVCRRHTMLHTLHFTLSTAHFML